MATGQLGLQQGNKGRVSRKRQTPSSRLRLLLACFLTLLCAASSLQAQAPPSPPSAFQADAATVIFDQLGLNNGLASPVVNAFAEDGNGFLWVGTQGGLQRWDGYRFWTYKLVPGNDTSIPDNFITALFTDSRGSLWIGTSAGGLARYDPEHDHFIRYRSSPTDMRRAHVSAIISDGANGLWIGSGTGLDHLDIVSGAFVHADLSTGDSGPQAQQVSALLRSPDGMLWVGSERGLQRSLPNATSDPFHLVFQRIHCPPGANPGGANVLFRDSRSRVWVGTQHGIYLFDHSALSAQPSHAQTTVLPIPASGPGNDLLATGAILSIAETRQGDIWLGTQADGILKLSGDASTVRRIVQDPTLPRSLSDDRVGTLFLGRSGIVWAGTRRGISYLDTTPRNVFSVLGGTGQNNTLSDTDVYAMLSRADGSVWLGLSKNGIDILDSTGHVAGGIRPHQRYGPSAASLSDGEVDGLVETGDGGVYICTQHGLFRAETSSIPASSGSHSAAGLNIRLSQIPIGASASEDIVQVLQEGRTLWIAGNNGLWLFNLDQSAASAAYRPALKHPLTDERIDLMRRGPGHTLWVGTQNGLNLINLDTLDVENILSNPSDPAAIGAGLISSLITDRQGRLWVGTFSGGVAVMEGRDAQGRPRFHTILAGLPNENIDTLLEAPDGNIWASTDGGLAIINPHTFDIRILREAEGSFISVYWNGVGVMTRAGELLFGGQGGMTVVRPEMPTTWTYQPPVVVTDARIGAKKIPIGRFNGGADEYPIWIPPSSDDLTVEFAALDYTAPERNRYEYKLEDFDLDWVPAEAARRVARYTNLPPGRYVLMLRGSNRDGVWSPTRSIRILVLPAWYQSLWFHAIVVVCVLALLIVLFLLGAVYSRRRQQELERQVALRTAELRTMTEELQQSQQQLEHMAYTDSLTGLPNRRMFTENFRRLIAFKRRQDEASFALLLLDFDGFKSINDTHGHDAGDAVLKEMALRLSGLVRESDTLARLGGDEFGLLLAQSLGVEGTESVCQKIIESFVAPIHFEGIELRTAPSIGIALYPEDGESQESLYKSADLALYQAKRNGGNSCAWTTGARENVDGSSTPAQIQ